MSLPVLTVTGARWESDLVSNLERGSSGMDVVRRCVDLPDLLATAASGQARAVLVSSDLRRLDREAVARLIAGGVAVVGVVNPDDREGEEHLYRLGIGKLVTSDATADVLAQAVAEAVELSNRSGDLQGGEYVISEPRTAMPAAPPFEEIPHYEQGRGSVVAYAVELKTELLGVPADLLERLGPVHPEVAAAMAEGVRDRLGATYGLGTTGVAGPDPHGVEQVGVVDLACAGPGGTRTIRRQLPGDRETIRNTAVDSAIELLLDVLRARP